METRDIIRAAGGPSHVARLIGKKHSTISEWSRVPAEHVAAVAKASGIAPSVIRPDVFGPIVGLADNTAGDGEGSIHEAVAAPGEVG